MADEFEKILDECADRINQGESLEKCLTDYPEYAGQLEPLLRTMIQTQEVFKFQPSDDAKRVARQRFYAALDKKKHPSFWQRFSGRRWAVASVIGVFLIAIVSYFGLRTTVFNQE